MNTASPDLVHRYAAWASKLEENMVSLARQRRVLLRMLPAALLLSALGFAINVWVGVGTFATGLWVCAAGLYLTMMRAREYREELARTQAQLRRMEAE
jgi:hypothetical protein